jgi:MFS family permease
MCLAALCHFNRVSISVAGSERLMNEFSLSAQQLGGVYSAYLVVYTLLMIPGGWLLDRYGPTQMLAAMAAGSVVFVSATALVGLPAIPVSALGLLIVVRAALGATSVPMHPGAANMVANWFAPATRAPANGFVTAAALVGIALSYPLFGALIDTVGWRVGMLVSALVTAAVACVWSIVARDRPNETMSDSAAASPGYDSANAALLDKPSVAPNPAEVVPVEPQFTSLLLLTFSYAAVGYFQYLFFYWSQYYFEHVLDLGPQHGRFAAMLLSLAMAAGPFWTAVVEVAGRRRGTAAAVFNTGGNVGGLLAPYATPVISGWLGWQSGIAVASAFCLVGAALWIWVRPP